jgi:hypothetical protein
MDKLNEPLNASRLDICLWFQSFRNALESEIGEQKAAEEVFSMPSFWTEHILLSDPVAIAKDGRYYQSPGKWPIASSGDQID